MYKIEIDNWLGTLRVAHPIKLAKLVKKEVNSTEQFSNYINIHRKVIESMAV